MNSSSPEDRVILVDKPAGLSSFGVVARVRRQLTQEFGHRVKVGHAGTLDPFATGLLILLSGKRTREFDNFQHLDKLYKATMYLGAVSSTGDPEGKIIEIDERVPSLSEIEEALERFVGVISQQPPQYSAIKINGQRAYKLARKGVEFEMPTREVTIYEIRLLSYEYPLVEFLVRVSSGTYIRTLAEDIGNVLGVGAYLTELRRLSIGNYKVTDAVSVL